MYGNYTPTISELFENLPGVLKKFAWCLNVTLDVRKIVTLSQISEFLVVNFRKFLNNRNVMTKL